MVIVRPQVIVKL